MIRPGLVSISFRPKKPDEIIALCVKNGLEAIEWGENAHIMPDDPQGAKELYEKTIANGLEVAAYGSYYRVGTYDDSREVFAKSLVNAKALHAPILRVWAGEKKPSTQFSAEDRSRVAKDAAFIASMAQDEGIKVAFEWHGNSLTDTNESGLQLLNDANHDNLYCLWQPTVALSVQERIEGIRMLGDRLLNVHTYYWPEGIHRPLQEGEEVWKQYYAAMSKGRDRFSLLEFVMNNTDEQLAEDASTLKRWIRQWNL